MTDPLDDRPASEPFRHAFARVLCFASPFLAAAVAVSLTYAMKQQRTVALDLVTLLFGNAALAALGSGIGAVLRPGRVSVRVAGAFAYGILALFAYGFALAAGFAVLGIR